MLDPSGDRRCRPAHRALPDQAARPAARRVRAGPDDTGRCGVLRITGPEPDLALVDGKEDLAAALSEDWLRLSEPGRPEAYHPLNPGIDAGEASCIALALGRRQRGLKSLLILDDRAGRAEARRLDLELTGTAAVVAMARLRGLIPAAGPVLQELCGNGYCLSNPTVDTVLRH